MRKYQQVALLFLALVSVFGLLLYRKEYVELRSTFEGFNIFGDSRKLEDCVIFNETFNIGNVKPYYPLSGWMDLEDNFFVYSAFWRDKGVSIAVGIGQKKSVPRFKCHIWYDFRDTLFSNDGVFSYNEIEVKNSSYSLFEFFCDIGSAKIEGVPYMFVFIINKEKHFVPIVVNKQKDHASTALCVHPDYLGLSKTAIIEFIAYHKVIGFSQFVVYDELHFGLLPKLKEVLLSFGWLKSIEILPWRFPLSKNDPSAKAVLERDCVYRFANRVSYLALLNIEEYIIPKLHNKIDYITNNKGPSLSFLYRKCCVDLKFNKTNESLPLILRKTYCSVQTENRQILINPEYALPKSTINSSYAVVNSYQPCSFFKMSDLIYDVTPRIFFKEVLKSEIISLWNTGSLF